MAVPQQFRFPSDAVALARLVEQAVGPNPPRKIKDAIDSVARAFGDRDRDLEDWLAHLERELAAGGVATSVVFSYPGALDSGVSSPLWFPRADLTFTFLRLSLFANATTNHTVELVINGVDFAAYTLNAGSKTTTFAISCPVLTTQSVNVRTVAVTDTDLSLQLAP